MERIVILTMIFFVYVHEKGISTSRNEGNRGNQKPEF